MYPYSVNDGGGTNRDVVTGDIAQLGLDVGDEIEVVGTNGGLYLVNDITSTSMTLNYSNGSPASALQTGSGNAADWPAWAALSDHGVQRAANSPSSG
ncbi:hypothetical protein ACPA9J_15985 [Pseudomonas aeruginosa]